MGNGQGEVFLEFGTINKRHSAIFGAGTRNAPIHMQHHLLTFASLLMMSCNSFHELAETTRIDNDEQYVTVQNAELNIRTRTYGDISFALSNKEFKELTNSRPEFKDILFYLIKLL